jgi:two-component system NtrC family sensor kinase
MLKFTPWLKKAVVSIISYRHFVLTASIVFLLITVFAIILVFQNAIIMRDRISEDFNQQQLVLARQAASQIAAELGIIKAEIETISRVAGESDSREELLKAIRSSAERIRTRGFLSGGLVDTRASKSVVGYPGQVPESIVLRVAECAGSVASDSAALCPLQVEVRENGENRITALICRRITDPHIDADVVFMNIDVSQMVENVTGKIRSGKTGYAWVVDQLGVFLYHPEHEFVGKNAFTARQQKEPYISFTRINEIMRDQMLRGLEGTGVYSSGWHRGMKGKVTKLIGFAPVTDNLLDLNGIWSVAVAAPTTEVAEAIHGVYVRHVAAVGAIVTGMFIFSFLFILYQRQISESLQERVSEQEKYISSILQNSRDAIIFIDNDNRVKVWNKGAEMVFGYSSEEMMGQTFHRIIPPSVDAEEELGRIRSETLEKGHIRNYQAKRLRKDGKIITIDLSRTLVKDENGNIIGSTAIIKDVTEKSELESKIYNTEKLASIGNLAAGVAHEINNPLAVILGFVDLLQERFEKGSREYEDLKVIEENANNARKIVQNLLGFARVTEGTEDLVDIGQSVEKVSNIVRNTMMTKKIDFDVNIPDGLPQVRGDSREFQQVIFNLINNAIAAMEPDGGSLVISARTDGEHVHVDVTDTGVGIPEDIKGKVFDPFFTTKKVGKGTGLGLSLCYGIVNKYGGRISFTSVSAADDPGRPSGTTFTVTLPIDGAEGGSKEAVDETEYTRG